VDKKHVIHWVVQQEFKLRLHKDAGHAQSFQLVASQCCSKMYMKLDCKHLLIMRLSGEASFEAKEKVIHWLMLIQWPVHDCTNSMINITKWINKVQSAKIFKILGDAFTGKHFSAGQQAVKELQVRQVHQDKVSTTVSSYIKISWP
jgi:hypothetical protein